jgi:hypothetical protein
MSIARMMQMAAGASSGGSGVVWTDPDLANASYDSKSFATTAQETVAFDLDFTPDGTSFVIVGQATDYAYQYDCSTAWDVSTASYSGNSLDLSSQVNSPRGVQYNYNGTKIYVLGAVSDKIYQYSLSTEYDVSSGSYDNVNIDLGATESNYAGGQFYIPSGGSQDGTKLYAGSYNSDKVYSWTLSTAWDLSTASLDAASLDVRSFDGVHGGIYVNPDGTKWWLGARVSDKIYQFSMSTPYDISTSSKDTAEFSWASQTTNIYGFRYKNDGSKLYAMAADTIYQYSTA